MAGGPRGANCTPQPAPTAPREIRPELDTSSDGADLLHGSDRGHHPELDHLGISKLRWNKLFHLNLAANRWENFSHLLMEGLVGKLFPKLDDLGGTSCSTQVMAGKWDKLSHFKPRGKRTEPNGNRLGYQWHLQIRRPLKLRSQAVIVSADHLYRFETGKPWVYASAAHPSRFQIPMGDAGKFPGTSGAQPSFQTADGAQKILAADGRSVTRAFPGVVEIAIPGASTTGKPVDTGAETRNVSRTSRIGQQAIDFPEILKIRGMATEVRFTHIGAGNFSYASGKAGNPALAPNTPFRGAFPQSVEKAGDSLNLRGSALKRYTPAREVTKRYPLGRCPGETPSHPTITEIVTVANAWAVIKEILTTGSTAAATVVESTMVEMPEIFPACPFVGFQAALSVLVSLTELNQTLHPLGGR